jgi:hypothetical protein
MRKLILGAILGLMGLGIAAPQPVAARILVVPAPAAPGADLLVGWDRRSHYAPPPVYYAPPPPRYYAPPPRVYYAPPPVYYAPPRHWDHPRHWDRPRHWERPRHWDGPRHRHW